MMWFIFISFAVITALCLIGPLLTSGDKPPARGNISFFLLAFMIASLGIYSLIGRPELTQPNALKPYQSPPGPSAEDVKAAQSMSVEDRAEMIIAMVDQLAERLTDNPENPQGWIRLLRARTVLGQEVQKAKDIETIKAIFSDRPDTLSQILNSNKP